MKLKEYVVNTKGAVAIEFAIAIPILFALVSGVMNFGLILTKKHELNSVLNVGFLYAIQSSSSLDAITAAMDTATNMTPLTTTATQFCGCSDGTVVACNATCSGGDAPATYVRVTASSTVPLFSPAIVLTNPYPISTNATIRVN